MECWFQRYDDRRAGRVAGIRVDRPAKKRGERGERREKVGERGRERIKRHKVARSITRRAGPRVIFVEDE